MNNERSQKSRSLAGPEYFHRRGGPKTHPQCWLIFGSLVLLAVSAVAEDRIALSGHVPLQLRNAAKLERAPADETVQMSLVVRLDPVLMTQVFDQIYGPGAPANKHFLSSAEFAQQFGLAEKREKLADFARANGFTVDLADNQPESLVVKVSGGAGLVENAFGIELHHYRGPDGRVFRAHETEPTIPASLAPHLNAVLGLTNNHGLRHPYIRMGSRARSRAPHGFSGSYLGLLTPTDIKSVYGLGSVSLNGSGQSVALFELDGYDPSDITAYENQFDLPAAPINFVGVDTIGTTPRCGGNQDKSCTGTEAGVDDGMGEVSLDIEMVEALAPGVSQIRVYEAPNTDQGVIDGYAKIASENIAKSVSTSWGVNESLEGLSAATSESGIFYQMSVQGQSMYAASGDCGAYDTQDGNGNCTPTGMTGYNVDDPASQPYVTGAGGTTLAGSLASPTETAWNTFVGAPFPSHPGATGGGVSLYWPIPSWQVGLAGISSTHFRNVPDVALNADPDNSPYALYFDGGWYYGGGTSAVAPLWAAFTALINQRRVAVGLGFFGFANPTLYQQGAGSSYHDLFNDVTTGDNGTGGGGFAAGVGYDNDTGLGSFKGSALFDAMTEIPPPSIVRQPSNRTVEPGQTATFTVQATSIGLIYQWQIKEPGVGVTDIPGAVGSSYITPPVTMGEDQTQFDCVVHNASGTVTSNAATLTVKFPSDLSNVLIFPNPWDRRKHVGYPMRFTGLPDGATVKLFTVSGHFLRELHPSGGLAEWDLANDSGQSAASGYYLYLITDAQGSRITGKIAIIR